MGLVSRHFNKSIVFWNTLHRESKLEFRSGSKRFEPLVCAHDVSIGKVLYSSSVNWHWQFGHVFHCWTPPILDKEKGNQRLVNEH